MRVLVWNVNGLGPTLRNIELEYGGLGGFFRRYDADVVCFQETKVQEDKVERSFACVRGYESFWACSQAKKGYSGVCTWVCRDYSPIDATTEALGLGRDDLEKEGRVLSTDLGAFVLINVYVPNAGDPPERPRLEAKLRFLEKLRETTERLRTQGRAVLVVGDFNVTTTSADHHPIFKLDEIYSSAEISAFQALLRLCSDAWRILHPQETDTFTVFNEKKSYRDSNKGLRIDYALASPGLMEKVTSCEVLDTPKKWSDHKALLLELHDVPTPEVHDPCPLSSAIRFKPTKTLTSMFGGLKRKKGSKPEPSQKRKEHDGLGGFNAAV